MNMNVVSGEVSGAQVLAASGQCDQALAKALTSGSLLESVEQSEAARLPAHSKLEVAALWRQQQTHRDSNTSQKTQGDQSDQLLVQRAIAGNKRAFDLLVMKYQSRIARLISVYVKDADNVQDVLQETFIRAFKALKQYRSESQFYTWLYRIAVNTSFSFLKANKTWHQRFDAIEESEDFHEPAPHIDEPDSVIHNQHLNVAIKSAFESLPLKLRTTLALRELEGMSYEAIAEITEVDLGTVKSRLSRARSRVMAQTEDLYRASHTPA